MSTPGSRDAAPRPRRAVTNKQASGILRYARPLRTDQCRRRDGTPSHTVWTCRAGQHPHRGRQVQSLIRGRITGGDRQPGRSGQGVGRCLRRAGQRVSCGIPRDSGSCVRRGFPPRGHAQQRGSGSSSRSTPLSSSTWPENRSLGASARSSVSGSTSKPPVRPSNSCAHRPNPDSPTSASMHLRSSRGRFRAWRSGVRLTVST